MSQGATDGAKGEHEEKLDARSVEKAVAEARSQAEWALGFSFADMVGVEVGSDETTTKDCPHKLKYWWRSVSAAKKAVEGMPSTTTVEQAVSRAVAVAVKAATEQLEEYRQQRRTMTPTFGRKRGSEEQQLSYCAAAGKANQRRGTRKNDSAAPVAQGPRAMLNPYFFRHEIKTRLQYNAVFEGIQRPTGAYRYEWIKTPLKTATGVDILVLQWLSNKLLEVRVKSGGDLDKVCSMDGQTIKMGSLGNITLAMKSRDAPQKNQPHDLAEEEAEIKAVRHDGTPAVDFGTSEIEDETSAAIDLSETNDAQSEGCVVSLSEVELATNEPADPNGLAIGHASVSTASLQTLEGSTWVNDEVMSAFFALLQREDGVVAFGTALMTKLQTKGVSQDTMTKWWTRSAGCTLDQATIIVMPVHVRDNHWIVVAANTATKMITSYCSLGRNDYGKYNGHMAVFLSAQRTNTEHKLEWSSSSQSLDQARQRDGNECGVFACMTAMALAKGRSPDSYTADQVYKGSMGRRIIQLSLRRETLHDWCDEEAPEVDSSEGTEPHGEEIPTQEES